ncbi:hypothetical protein TA3x_001410 [Tundrisphaera sp. TA3]|uniref:hypothetical protein n=1 Tax=Tundrisphaera sp. TA3 TaxID=3435775 RepID=UPI003EB714D7
MPSRMACVAILSFWVYAAFGLFRRDILPDLIITPPPDMRSIAKAEASAGPTRWDIMVADDANLRNLHSVGQAVTDSRRRDDGTIELTSDIRVDSARLLRGTPLASAHDEAVDISNSAEIDQSGNLLSFRSTVRPAAGGLDLRKARDRDREHDSENLITLDGRVNGKQLFVVCRSPYPVPLLNWNRPFPYEPRGMVENSVGPIDRMPGLQVGQRWESRVVSPLTGRVEIVTVEVAGKHAIHWGNSVITTLEVVHHLPPNLTARTWVRPDGLVLRQEVPFPFVKLILERIPGPGDGTPTESKAP